jgi:hypothetical protein
VSVWRGGGERRRVRERGRARKRVRETIMVISFAAISAPLYDSMREIRKIPLGEPVRACGHL